MESNTANTLERLFSLEGRVGIVTGASGGIGEGIANVLANVGAKVYDLSRSGKGSIDHSNNMMEALVLEKPFELVYKEVLVPEKSEPMYYCKYS